MARRLLLLLLPVLHVWGAERGAASTARGVQPAADSGSASRDVSATLPDCSVPREYLSGGALPALQRIPVAITSGGLARTFLLVLPQTSTGNASTPLPLVLALSGAQDDAAKLLDVRDVYPDGPASVHVDAKATAAGFVVIAPNSLCDSPVANGTCAWGSTTTALDPAPAAGSVLKTNEMPFFVDAVRCVRDVLRVPLNGDVYAMGFSQGGKLASRFGCEGAAASGGELRVRAVAAAEALYTAQPALRGACAAGASDAAPPPMLLFQAQNENVVPFCVAGAVYAPTNVYWTTWAGLYNDCVPDIPLAPGSNEIGPPIMQSLCAPDAATLPPIAAAKEMVATSAARVANATRLLRVYTNGLRWCVWCFGCRSVSAHADIVAPCATSTRPLALFWTYDVASHLYPGPMAALGGLDFTDVALRFFTNVRERGDAPMFGNNEAFAPLLSGFAPCTAQVAAPALLPALPGLNGYSAGPCLDLQAQAGPLPSPPPTDGGLSF